MKNIHTSELKFIYNRTEKEIEERIGKGRRIVGTINTILWSKSISKKRKHDLCNTIFKSVVLYGWETWQLNKRLKGRLATLEMDFWCRSAEISKGDRIRNERVREIMNVETTILEEINQRKQLYWYGHVQRMSDERIPKQVLNWVPIERKTKRRGRLKITWMMDIQKAMSESNLQPGDWLDRRH